MLRWWIVSVARFKPSCSRLRPEEDLTLVRPGMSRIPMDEVVGRTRDSNDFSGEELPVVDEGGVRERLLTLLMMVATTLLYRLVANPSRAL